MIRDITLGELQQIAGQRSFRISPSVQFAGHPPAERCLCLYGKLHRRMWRQTRARYLWASSEWSGETLSRFAVKTEQIDIVR